LHMLLEAMPIIGMATAMKPLPIFVVLSKSLLLPMPRFYPGACLQHFIVHAREQSIGV
jgi:hypothetical protein